MTCQRCRTHLLSRLQFQQHVVTSLSSCARSLPLVKSQSRSYSDTPNIPAMPPPPVPRQLGPDSNVSIPSAIPSAIPGIPQPLSTPGEVHTSVSPAKSIKPVMEREPSSCAAGTKLQGLNYFKNKPDVFALGDSEYPDWLWSLLDDSRKQSKTEADGVDPSAMNKKQRKRHENKMAALAANQPRKIPVHEQSIDITPAPYNTTEEEPQDIVALAAASLEKRTEITKSAREARRKGIQESNFLRGL